MMPSDHSTIWPLMPITSSEDFLYMGTVKLPRMMEQLCSMTEIMRVIVKDCRVRRLRSSREVIALVSVLRWGLGGLVAGNLSIQLSISRMSRSRNILLVR
jgi:hypothetical protein